jgi:hypothetical protein
VGDRRLELELFHQWSIDSYRSLIFQGDDDSVWRDVIPHTALNFDYLLYAIFAISALHISSMSVLPRSKTYQMAALEYQNLAITAFRTQDSRDTPETSQSMCAFSILHLVLTVAFPAYLGQDASILDNLATLFELLQGTRSIISSARTSILNGPFGNFVRQSSHMQAESLSPNINLAFERLRILRDEEYAASVSASSALDAFRIHESTSKAIERLEVCFGLRSGNNMLVVCFRWFSTIDAGFVKRIGDLDPLALLITMHWGILLADIGREKWWARSSGKALVAEISGVLSVQKPEWLPIMSVVHREVGLPP